MEEDVFGKAFDHKVILRMWQFVRPYRRQMAIALEARGYGASGVVRTYYKAIQMRTLDWVLIVAGSALFAAILFLNLNYGFGNEAVYLF